MRRGASSVLPAVLPAVLAAAVLSAALVALGACQSSEHEGGLDLERMVDQPRWDAYEATDLFADGSVMRLPPEGILPFGDAVPPSAVRTGRAAAAGAERGEPVARIPVALDPALLAAGRKRFDVYCAVCHGFDGNAATPVAAAMELRPPPSLHQDRIRAMPPGRLFEVASEGYGLMPGYAGQLTPEERWAVVAYVRALQLSRRLSMDTLPPALRASVLERLEQAAESGPGARDSIEGGAP